MNWNRILEDSWHHITKRRYLLWLGLLAAITEGGSFFTAGSYKSSGEDFNNLPKIDQAVSSAGDWLSSHSLEIAVVFVALFVIGLIILYISYSARAGLIRGINLADEGKESNFHRDFEVGKKFFWRFLGLRFLVTIVLILILFLLILTFVGAFALSANVSGWLILPIALLCIPAIFGFILFAFYLSLATRLAERCIVIDDQRVISSIEKAVVLVRNKLGPVLIAWLISMVVNIVAGVVCAIIVILPLVAFIVLGIIAYALLKVVGLIIVISLALVVLIAIGLLAQSLFVAYLSAFWTLVYKSLNSKP